MKNDRQSGVRVYYANKAFPLVNRFTIPLECFIRFLLYVFLGLLVSCQK